MWRQKYHGNWYHPEFEGSVSFKYFRDIFRNAESAVLVYVRGVEYATINTNYIDLLDESKVLDWVMGVCLDDAHLDQSYTPAYLDGREFELEIKE